MPAGCVVPAFNSPRVASGPRLKDPSTLFAMTAP